MAEQIRGRNVAQFEVVRGRGNVETTIVSKVNLPEGRELYVARRQGNEQTLADLGSLALAPLDKKHKEIIEDTLADNEGDIYRSRRIHAMLAFTALRDNPSVAGNDYNAQLVAHIDPSDEVRSELYGDVLGLEHVMVPQSAGERPGKTMMTASMRDAYGNAMWTFHDLNILPVSLAREDNEIGWIDERTA